MTDEPTTTDNIFRSIGMAGFAGALAVLVIVLLGVHEMAVMWVAAASSGLLWLGIWYEFRLFATGRAHRSKMDVFRTTAFPLIVSIGCWGVVLFVHLQNFSGY